MRLLGPRAALRTGWALAGLLVAGGCKEPTAEERAITVVITVDTLSQAMANQVGLCAELQALVGDYGLDLACMEGAVAPSSWTGESHTRFLFPQNTIGKKRRLPEPPCGQESVLGSIRQGNGGYYIFGTDNLVLGDSSKEPCAWGRTAFTQGADKVWETSLGPEEMAPLPEEERPVDQALSSYETQVSKPHGLQMFLNFLEPGGHEPRCWSTPTSAACEELWQLVVSGGLVEADADRVATWLDGEFYGKFMRYFGVTKAEQESRWRPLFWSMIEDGVQSQKGARLLDRLRRLLDATREAGRLGDLRLVIVGDHGENPCVLRGLGDDGLNCGHLGLPSEYTAFVPVYTSPAALGLRWVEAEIAGEGGKVWALSNMGHGLVAEVGLPIPEDWPAMEPVGTATSWICEGPEGSGQSGVHIEGEQAARCRHGTCDAATFRLPTDGTSTSETLTEVPENLAPWVAEPDWFTTACKQ
ncbi:MAG TPA: hypothetical protein PKY30_13540 [Myxococcota bacterium]|nr:hypothetical protein [Myxococcota bacterium]